MKIFSLPLIVLLLFAGGCAEKPKSIGNGLPNIDGIFTIEDTVLTASFDTTYRAVITPGFSLSNLVGRLSPTEEVITLINIIPGTSIDSLTGAVIDTAELRLTVNYRFTPQTPPISFQVLEVKKGWSQSTFTADSLPSLTLGATILGTFSDSMNYSTVATALLTDTSAIRNWANAHSDSTFPDFYGFAVKAPAGATTGVIGFSTFSNYITFVPQLFIRYTKNGRRDSLVYYSGEDTYAASYTGPAATTPLTLQGGFGVRSKIRFDLSSFTGQPIINNATMELTLDTAASVFGGYSPDTVTALMGVSDALVDSASTTIYVYGYKKAAVAGTSPVYTFPLTGMADRWVRSVNPNHGINLRWGAEGGTVERAVFYSSTNADPAKRPKLNLIYSKK